MLGAGGPVRAYTDCIASALPTAEKVERVAMVELGLELPYELKADCDVWPSSTGGAHRRQRARGARQHALAAGRRPLASAFSAAVDDAAARPGGLGASRAHCIPIAEEGSAAQCAGVERPDVRIAGGSSLTSIIISVLWADAAGDQLAHDPGTSAMGDEDVCFC